MTAHDHDPWSSVSGAVVGAVLLLAVGVAAYAALAILLGLFGMDLPVPAWLWNLGDRLLG